VRAIFQWMKGTMAGNDGYVIRGMRRGTCDLFVNDGELGLGVMGTLLLSADVGSFGLNRKRAEAYWAGNTFLVRWVSLFSLHYICYYTQLFQQLL
jgi:hypothetical protein